MSIIALWSFRFKPYNDRAITDDSMQVNGKNKNFNDQNADY